MLDLHSHTTYSDGTLTPSQFVRTVAERGVRALAISDHDTIAGWDEAIATGDECGVEIVPAVELSTTHNGRSLHVLGFYPNRDRIQAPLNSQQEGRKQRAHDIVQRLAELGYPVTLPNLGEGVVPSRPHIANAMVAAGHVRDTNEAFDRFLKDDGLAYVHYPKLSTCDGIAMIRDCGGIPVWAHPFLFRGGLVHDVLPEFCDAGLMGLEVVHPTQGKKQRATLMEMCETYSLIATGGNDYHGPAPGQPIRYTAEHAIELEALDRLKQARVA